MQVQDKVKPMCCCHTVLPAPGGLPISVGTLKVRGYVDDSVEGMLMARGLSLTLDMATKLEHNPNMDLWMYLNPRWNAYYDYS